LAFLFASVGIFLIYYAAKPFKIVRGKDSKAELTSGELMALVKGRLQPVAELGFDLHQAVVFVFEALWPGWAVPDDIKTLLKWIPLVPNRVDVWKESVA
jgi:hypothetical protein